MALITEPALARLTALVRDVPDFPRSGVVFKDITPLLADPSGLYETVMALAKPWESQALDGQAKLKVLGIEARGFVLGAPVALQLHAGFVPVRKAGKLPGPTLARSYSLEYGPETMEIHAGALSPGDQVLIVDDVIATGGTVAAAAELIRDAGALLVGVSALMELESLGGREHLARAGIEDGCLRTLLRF